MSKDPGPSTGWANRREYRVVISSHGTREVLPRALELARVIQPYLHRGWQVQVDEVPAKEDDAPPAA